MSSYGDFLRQAGNTLVNPIAGVSNAIGSAVGGIGDLLNGSPKNVLRSDPNVPVGTTLPQLNNYLAQAAPTPPPTSTDTTGTSGSYGGTTPAYQDITPYLQQAQGDVGNIQNLYSQLFGGVDKQVQDQSSQLNNQYAQQFQNADKAFANTQNTTNNMMYARGAGDSSYNAAAQGANQDIYNQDHQNLVNAQQQGLAKLGQYAQTAKAGLTAGQNADKYDLSQYTDVPSLVALHQQLGQHIGSLQQQLAGLGTNQDYLNTVNQIAPQQSQAATQLSQKLANLVSTSASPEAKDALAQGYISEASLTDPNAKQYWLGYFNDLNKKAQQAPTPLAPTVG